MTQAIEPLHFGSNFVVGMTLVLVSTILNIANLLLCSLITLKYRCILILCHIPAILKCE
jgi:hypothetical protein